MATHVHLSVYAKHWLAKFPGGKAGREVGHHFYIVLRLGTFGDTLLLAFCTFVAWTEETLPF